VDRKRKTTSMRAHHASWRSSLICLFAGVALLSAPLAAQKKPPVETPKLAPHLGDLESAKAQAKERNAPVLIHMVLDGEVDNDSYREKVLKDTELIKASVGAVVLIANNGTHSKKEVDGKKVCDVYPMFDSCGKHQQNWDALYGLYKEDSGDLRCPQVILLLPDGKEHMRWHDGTVPAADDVRGALVEAVKLAGPSLTAEQLETVKKLAAEGRTADAAADAVAAWKAWNGVLQLTAKGQWATEATKGRDAAWSAVQLRVQTLYADLVPGKVVAAVDALQALAKELAGTPLEKEIQQRLKKAEAHKELKDELAKARLEAEAGAILKEAETAADLGDDKKAEKAARRLFAKKYRATGAARVGKERWPDLYEAIERAEREK